MIHLRPLFAAALAALGAACANVPLTESGFLDDYSGMRPAPELEVDGIPDSVRVERSQVLDRGGYHAVLVEPAVWMRGSGHWHEPTPEAIERVLDEFRVCLEKGLGQDFAVVEQPGAGVLRVRPAVTALDRQDGFANMLAVVVLLPFDMGGISGEIAVEDSVSGERLFAMTARREGSPFLILEAFTPYGHAYHGMWKWSRLLALELAPRVVVEGS